MISSVLSNDEELEVNNAYAKIGLIANRVWANDQEDSYIKLNRLLWVQNCKFIEIHDDNNEKKSQRVRDVIPTSRLAQYGDYEYDEEREKMYKANDVVQVTRLDQREQFHPDDRTRCNEPWMLKQVEDYFLRLSSPVHKLSSWLSRIHASYHEENGTKTREFEANFEKNTPPLLYTVSDKTEQELQARVCSKLVKDLWNARPSNSYRSDRTRGFYDCRSFNDDILHKFRHSSDKRQDHKKHNEQPSYYSNTDQTLILKRQNFIDVSVPDNRRPVFRALSAEVPEFFPKGPPTNDNDHQLPIQFFPSSSERNYHHELFPYNQFHTNTGCVPIAVSHTATVNNFIRAPNQWIHRMVPPIRIQVPGICTAAHQPIYSTIQPICPTIIHRPISINEKIILPGQTNPGPIPVYQKPAELYQESSQKRCKNHHGVDFKNLILLTKNSMKARRNQSNNSHQSSGFILKSRQSNFKSEPQVSHLLKKEYPKAREFSTVDSLVSEFSEFENKCKRGTSEVRIDDNSTLTKMNDNDEATAEDSNIPITRRRLYSDVLTNSTSSEFILETVLDRRYDELEQQAMEQYKTSEESLTLRYQELERQALEQYKNSETSLSSSESIRAKRSSTICTKKYWQNDEEEGESDEDGASGSGFENRACRNRGKNISYERGTVSERKIMFKSENKCSSMLLRSSIGENKNIRRTTIGSKSLTALNNEIFEGNSKNTIKGASGDKIEEHVESSLNNRHLLLVSPFKQSIPIRKDIITDKVIPSYYRKPKQVDSEIASNGGDEKVTILRSPLTQVWLSSIWR